MAYKNNKKKEYTAITTLINRKFKDVKIVRDGGCRKGKDAGKTVERYARIMMVNSKTNTETITLEELNVKDTSSIFNRLCLRKACLVIDSLSQICNTDTIRNAAYSNKLIYDDTNMVCGIPDIVIETETDIFIIELKTTLNSVETHMMTYSSNAQQKYGIYSNEKSKHILQLLWYMDIYARNKPMKNVTGSIWHIVGNSDFELIKYDIELDRLSDYKTVLFTITNNNNLYSKITYSMIEPHIEYDVIEDAEYNMYFDILVGSRIIKIPVQYIRNETSVYTYIRYNISDVRDTIQEKLQYSIIAVKDDMLHDMIKSRMESTLIGVNVEITYT